MKISIRIIALFFLFFIQESRCQTPEYWGMTVAGGKDFGTIFKTDQNGENFELIHLFGENGGRNPNHSPLVASNGKVYGVTQNGGEGGYGAMFEYDSITNLTSKKIDFYDRITGNASTNLVQAVNGNIYGMTRFGSSTGAAENGTIYEYNPITDSTRIIFYFDYQTTGTPFEGFYADTSGMLYASAPGGSAGLGVIFEFDPSLKNYSKKYEFTDSLKGIYPNGIVRFNDGFFYGTTIDGGLYGKGVLYRYNVNNNSFKKLYDFTTTQGNPHNKLLEGPNGKIYGVTAGGGLFNTGILYEFDSIIGLTKIKDFDPTTWSSAASQLIMGDSGKIFGTTSMGGAYDDGTLFEYDINDSTFTYKIHFEYTNKQGHEPTGVCLTSDGNLYGLTYSGGNQNSGVVFKYDPLLNIYERKINFWEDSLGVKPSGDLIHSVNGKLYGMAVGGGEFHQGIIFEIDPVNHNYSVKHSFGNEPKGGVGIRGTFVEGDNGNLFGLTITGGEFNKGTLFEYNVTSGQVIWHVNFVDSIGAIPRASLIKGPSGLLYGVTNTGGLGFGTIFSYNSSSQDFKLLYVFPNEVDLGINPRCDLLYLNQKLYGVAPGGINFNGVLFEFDLNTNTYAKLIDFDYSTIGGAPSGSLTKYGDSLIFGTLEVGGPGFFSSIYKYNVYTQSFKNVVECNVLNNGAILGRLMRATNGKLYGAAFGKQGEKGLIYEFDPLTESYIIKHQFTGSDGIDPIGGLIELYGSTIGIEKGRNELDFLIFPNPTSGVLYITSNHDLLGHSFRIISITGDIVMNGILSESQIIIKELDNGIYIIEIDMDNTRIRKKVLVSKF